MPDNKPVTAEEILDHASNDGVIKTWEQQMRAFRQLATHGPDLTKVVLKAMEAYRSQSGSRWVKASERLPEGHGKPVIVRSLRTGNVMLMQNLGHDRGWDAGMDFGFDYSQTEWLDESSPLPEDKANWDELETRVKGKLLPLDAYFTAGYVGSREKGQYETFNQVLTWINELRGRPAPESYSREQVEEIAVLFELWKKYEIVQHPTFSNWSKTKEGIRLLGDSKTNPDQKS